MLFTANKLSNLGEQFNRFYRVDFYITRYLLAIFTCLAKICSMVFFPSFYFLFFIGYVTMYDKSTTTLYVSDEYCRVPIHSVESVKLFSEFTNFVRSKKHE